jgi:hypothetical protein
MLTIDHIAAECASCCRRAARAASCWCTRARLSPAVGRRRPGDQKKNAVSAWRLGLLGQGAFGHRVLLAQLGERRVGAEQAVVVRAPPAGSPAPRPATPYRAVGLVVGVAAHLVAHAAATTALVGLARRLPAATARQPDRRSAPSASRCSQSPTSRARRRRRGPRRAELLAARGHPRLLAELDLRAGVEDFAVGRDDLLGIGGADR